MENENFYCKALGLLIGLIICAVLTALWGCGTGRTVYKTDKAYRADTLREIRVDTVWHDRFVDRIINNVRKESSRVTDSTATVVDEHGNVKRTDHWRIEKNDVSTELTDRLRDSVTMWKGMYEELLKVKADSVAMTGSKPHLASLSRDKPRGLWERWCCKVGEITTVLLVAAVVSLMIWLIRRRRER